MVVLFTLEYAETPYINQASVSDKLLAMWKDVSETFVTAAPDARVLWTSAKRAVVRATAVHEVRAVDSHTPRHVGCQLTKATTSQFERLGAKIDIDSVNSISADLGMFENVKHENVNGGTCIDMVYDLTVTDSDATVYTARLHLDDKMLQVCGGECSSPMVFYALPHLDSIRETMPDVIETLERAFGGTTSIAEETALGVSEQPLVHGVASAVTANRRMFSLGSNESPRSMLGTHVDKTVLYNQDREATHNITTYSVRVIDPSILKNSASKRYIIAQHVKIEDVWSGYSSDVVMSVAGLDTRGGDMCTDATTHKIHPYASLGNDLGVSTRNSTLHVFTNAKHYSMLLTHMHNASCARSLQLSAYASLNALCVSGHSAKSDIDNIMRSASMETLLDCSELPLIVERGSSSPFMCLVVPGVKLCGKTDVPDPCSPVPCSADPCSADSCSNCPCSHCSCSDEPPNFEQDECYLVDLHKTDLQNIDLQNIDLQKTEVRQEVPVSTLDINALPVHVQNALRRQWGS